MAKYRSLYYTSGNLMGANFFEANGKLGARDSTSMDAERIATDPAFERTRENMREFSGAATAGKSLRMGLSMVQKRYADKHFVGRLSGVFKRVCRGASAGQRGKRPIEVVPNKADLVGLSLHKTQLLEMSFRGAFTATPNPGRNGVTVDVPVFDVFNQLTVPAGATHCKLVLVAVAVSDHVYDEDKGKYAPVDANLNQLSAYVESAYLPVNTPVTAPLQLVANLPGFPAMTTTAGLVVCFGIEFHQQVLGNMYFFAQGNGMRIVDVF
jgi:hypothetical protein